MLKILTALCLLAMACGADKYESVNDGEKQLYKLRNEWLNETLVQAGESREARLSDIQYYENETQKIALINYTVAGEPGLYNLVVEKPGTAENMEEFGRIYFCTGLSCNCLVVVSGGGNVPFELKCNCTTCDMIMVDAPQPSILFEEPN